MANQNNEQCFCQSYYDDNNILRDCSCGKCGFSKQEIRKLELEASVPTLQDQREQLEADIKEVKEILYKLELKLVKLR